ncbi:MAG: site-specific integrase, partial [Planctomycetes bacterium]|nr:site-specific integrase [Planctomycetota bacterium]
AAKSNRRLRDELEAAKSKSFDECAAAYIAAHEVGWRNPKHRQQWRNTLSTYASPVIGRLPVADIDTDLVMRVLEPIWTSKPETAGRVRGRIESILDWAATRGYRTGENPARWRGHLDHLLPKRSKVRRVRHHPALPYSEIGGFVAGLRDMDSVAARALEFVILTAARTGEVLGVRWDEVDFETGVWTIPAERMKNGREHRVPLSRAALDVLESVRPLRRNDYVFPGNRPKRPLSNMALTMLLRRMGHDGITVHGFRSTFRDWAAEQTSAPREVAEMALAHTIGDSVEAAYRRGDLFEKRRDLMASWAEFVSAI